MTSPIVTTPSTLDQLLQQTIASAELLAMQGPTKECSLVITKLQEAQMWLYAAMAKQILPLPPTSPGKS